MFGQSAKCRASYHGYQHRFSGPTPRAADRAARVTRGGSVMFRFGSRSSSGDAPRGG